MEIPSSNQLKESADRALERGNSPRQVILGYAGISVLVGLALTILSDLISAQIDQTGGLSNLNLRTMLSTAQALLPIIQIVVALCLEMGYIHAMLRIARGLYADHTDLKMGFRRFGPVFRLTLLQALLYMGLGILAFFVSFQIYLYTPLSGDLAEMILSESAYAAIEDGDLTALLPAMMPLLLLYGALYLLCIIPVSYRLRMANYRLMDRPQEGAMAAIRASRKMMRHNCIRLFKVDLHLWWYYVLIFLTGLLAYGDAILALLGYSLPISDTVAYYLFYILSLAAQFALYYYARNGVEMRYVMAYDAITDRPTDNGVVLGNIFNM